MAAPVTLTRGQFARSRAAAAPGASYGRYLTYIAHHRGGGGGGAAAPDLSLQGLMRLATKLYGAPGTDQQLNRSARSTVLGEINPLVANITATLGAQSKATQAAIANATAGYQHEIGTVPAAVRADYRAAEASRAGVTDALTSYLNSQGAASNADLTSRIASIHAPAEYQQQVNQATSGLASGVAAANLARGSTGLEEILSRGGNQSAYADTLPAIVALAGLRNSKLAQTASSAQVADKVGALETQVPSLVATQLGSLRSERANRQANILHLANSLNDAAIKKQLAAQASSDRRYGINKSSADRRYTVDTTVNARSSDQAANRASREEIAQATRDAAWARAQLSAHAGTNKKAQSAVTSAFSKAASDAARMRAGTYGSAGQSLSSIFAGTATAGAGAGWDFHRAYNAIYAGIDAVAGTALGAAGVRRLTLRALARGGYPVTVTRGG